MARYVTTVESTLPPEEAFAYMSDFTHALEWDPSVTNATRNGEGFELVARFGGRDVPLHYDVVSLEPPRLVVLEARKPAFTWHARCARRHSTTTPRSSSVGSRGCSTR